MEEKFNNNINAISNKVKILYVSIILICIVALVLAVILQINKDKKEEQGGGNELKPIEGIEIDNYKKEFDNIFNNKVNYLENNSYRITKIEQDKEIVYLGYQNSENKINNYDLDVNIPYINIEDEKIYEYNNQIKETFEKKAKAILNATNDNAIYTVDYCAYVTNNILSVVIRSTLKEGNNAQRDIVQTYNYDLENKQEFTMEEALKRKGITKRDANNKIIDEIQKVQNNVKSLQDLGYKIYSRNVEDEMYNINNVTEYFIGKDDALYIVFAYGNTNNTSEMDIVIM